MTNILYLITQSEYGGAQRYVFDLANNLKGDFRVAVALGGEGNNGKLAKLLAENNIKYFVVPHLKRSLSPLQDILALLEIVKLINSYQPHIIHLNSSKISILGSIAVLFAKSRLTGRRIKSKIIYTVHGWVFNEPLPTWLKYFYLWAEKLTAKLKNKIICVSEFDRQLALKYKIAPAKKLITIHNGLAQVSFLSKEEAKNIILSKIEMLPLLAKERAGGEVLVGSIGHLYKTKGFKYFVQAADMLVNQNHISATFIIVGDGAERKNLENLIKEYNLENNFILLGQLDKAAEFLPAFDIYVCSSVKEGFPYSILEAMSAGRPIVSTDAGGIPEMIEDKITGLLVKPADAQNLAKKIKILLVNKTLTERLGQRAQAGAAAKFSLNKMIEETTKIYDN